MTDERMEDAAAHLAAERLPQIQRPYVGKARPEAIRHHASKTSVVTSFGIGCERNMSVWGT